MTPKLVRLVQMLAQEGAKPEPPFLLQTDTGRAEDLSQTVIVEDKNQDLKRTKLQPESSVTAEQSRSRPAQ